MKCERCESTENVIHHHTKYKEIHGVDKVIMLCESCHRNLHQNLRKKGKCDIPSSVIQKYSQRAYYDTPERKEIAKKYRDENINGINFDTLIDTNISLHEKIKYNNKSNTIIISVNFKANNKRKLLYKDIEE